MKFVIAQMLHESHTLPVCQADILFQTLHRAV